MNEKRNKRLSVPVTLNESVEITKRAQQANMSTCSYIRTLALNDEKIVMIDKSSIIIEHLGNICSEIQNVNYNCPEVGGSLESIEKEVMELWHLLR